MITVEEMISTHIFFQDMNPDHLHFIAGCASNVSINAGDYIFREGEMADKFFMIRHGTVALETHDLRKGPIQIQTLVEDNVLGWSWLFPPYRWQNDAHAMTLVRMTAFDGKCLREKCDADHDLGYELMKRFAGVLLEHLRASRLQAMNLYG